MQYRKLGRTDISVSVVCQGCWSIIGDSTWGPQSRDDSRAAIAAALDSGINFFDTAESYGDGESEQLLADVLSPRRKDVVLATKVSPSHLAPADLRAHCEQSLKRLRTDYIDLFQLHWPSPTVPIADTLAELGRLRQEGKIRAAGVSNFGVSYMRELLAAGRVESNQLCYSLLFRAIEHEIQPLCAANDIGILCYSPLCQALLTGKFASADDVPPGRARTRLFSKDRPQSRHNERGSEAETFEAIRKIRDIAAEIGRPMGEVALGWLLAQSGVASVIAGGRNAEQVRRNAAAGDLKLSSDVLRRLSEAAEPVKRIIGTNADMWQSESRLER